MDEEKLAMKVIKDNLLKTPELAIYDEMAVMIETGTGGADIRPISFIMMPNSKGVFPILNKKLYRALYFAIGYPGPWSGQYHKPSMLNSVPTKSTFLRHHRLAITKDFDNYKSFGTFAPLGGYSGSISST